MKKIILDFKPTGTPGEVQEYLAMKFDFPDWYGGNLDALYDMLTSITEPTCAGFFEPEEERPVSGYLSRVKMVMRDAEQDNPFFSVVFGNLEENFEENFDEGLAE